MKIKSVRELNEINFTKTINKIEGISRRLEPLNLKSVLKENEITLVGWNNQFWLQGTTSGVNSPEGTDLFNIDDLLEFVPDGPDESTIPEMVLV